MKTILLLLIIFNTQFSVACISKDLTLSSINPIDNTTFELNIKAFIPSQTFEHQVIILPPIGGVTTLESKYASKICARGVPAYVFVHWSDDMEESVEDLAVHNRGTIRGLHAVETFLKKYPLPTRILGTSLGGVYSGIATGKFNLIEKAVIIASGTNLPEIMGTSTLPELVALKNKRFDYHGFSSDEEYINEIKYNLSVEAMDYRENFKNKKLLFIRTNSDTVIKPTYQDQLIKLFSNENTTVYYTRYTHRNGIIMAYIRRSNRIANFLAY